MGDKKAQPINIQSLAIKSVQMNTLVQCMAKSFHEAAEKANIPFQFGKTFHCNNVYYGKVGSTEVVTKKEFVPGKFVQYINAKGSQCVILLQNEFHDKTDSFVHYTYEK